MLADGSIVADAVIHGYNWSSENFKIPEAAAATAGGFGFHQLLSQEGPSRLSEEEFLRDWQVEELEETIFLESAVDLVAYHGTPIYDFYKDGHSDTLKGVEFKRRNPHRTVLYGAANPFQGTSALDEIDKLAVEQGVDALKVYAARYENGSTYPQPLDDPEFGYPFIEKALERGITVIATHKAIPFGPVRSDPYRPQDLPEVCAKYPEMNFEIVHSGFAFLEETAFVASGFSNVWLNLEASAGLIFNAPRRFADFIGTFLMSGAEDRIVFASGCSLAHPQPLIEAFLEFEMPVDMVEGYGYPPLTEDVKLKILGENYLRLHNMDPEDLQGNVENDEWSSRRGDTGAVEPWSHVRQRLGTKRDA